MLSFLGVNGWISVNQSALDDGKDDFVERAFIWNTTGFKLADTTVFVVDPTSGVRRLDNYAIVPYSSNSNTENFDYAAGSTFGNITNVYSEPKTDPSRIGQTVTYEFTLGVRTLSTFSLLISKNIQPGPVLAHAMSQWAEKMGAPSQEVRHGDEQGAVPGRAADA